MTVTIANLPPDDRDVKRRTTCCCCQHKLSALVTESATELVTDWVAE